jgi:hypothetical protein
MSFDARLQRSPPRSCSDHIQTSSTSRENQNTPADLAIQSNNPKNQSNTSATIETTAKRRSPLPITKENLSLLPGSDSKKNNSGSATSSSIKCVTECLDEMNIEDIPQPGLPDISFSKPRLIQPIGNGDFGTVWLAEIDQNHQILQVAVKIPHRHPVSTANAQKEAAIALRLNHPNVIKTYGLDRDNNGIVMELAVDNLQKLFWRLDESPKNKRRVIAKSIAQQMINALFYLFRKQITHNDSHLENFFYKSDGKVVLGDLGSADDVTNGYLLHHAEALLRNSPFDRIKAILTIGNVCLSETDQSLIDEMQFHFCIKEPSKAEQKNIINTFIKLWASSQKWDCISNKKLSEEIQALPRD